MSTMEHTPGPWVYDPRSCEVFTENSTETIIAIVVDDRGCDNPQIHAGGLLTAAAPDLLEAIGRDAQMPKMQFKVMRRWSADVAFTAEIDCAEDAPRSLKLGLAVKWAVETRTNLTRANLAGADLACAYLVGANLTGANLTRADLAGAYLTRANLAGADLTRANLTGADLTRANLAGADLTRANLADADLTHANLNGADLACAYLADAYLADADLTDANLVGANLTGAEGRK